jgi:tetratricopeptide (TPR) repeat protein
MGAAMALAGHEGGTGDGQKFVETVLARLKPIETFARWFCVFLFAVIILVGVAIGIGKADCSASCEISAKIILTWSVSLTVAGASTAVGCLLGFLFGIPRSLQQRTIAAPANSGSKPPTPEAAPAADSTEVTGTQAFRSNTSLEEISDWLTKIIIGVGLVQFQTFLTYLYKGALLASAFVAGKEIKIATDTDLFNYSSDFSSPYFFALIITTLIAGCLFAYLETRTRLTLLFVSAEHATKEPVEGKLADSADRPLIQPVMGTGDGRGRPSAPAPATEADKDIARLSLAKLADPTDVTQLIGWASARARIGDYKAAEDALLDALNRDPGNNDIRIRIADVRRLDSRYAGYIEMINEAIKHTEDPVKRIPLLKRALLEALYIPPPPGFRQAIDLSDQLIALAGADAEVYLWRASAFGQSNDWLEKNSGSDQELKLARDKALEAATKVVELSPEYNSQPRQLLREIFNPKLEDSPLDENDLETFRGDEEFDKIIYSGKPASP